MQAAGKQLGRGTSPLLNGAGAVGWGWGYARVPLRFINSLLAQRQYQQHTQYTPAVQVKVFT